MFHTLNDIASHIKTLSENDWEKLFSLIPAIESTEKFVVGGGLIEDKNDSYSFIITPVHEAKVVGDFGQIMYDLNLVIDFDWGSWDEGRILADNESFENLDSITLLKLLTAFIRNNRFRDGALASRFEDKSITKILVQLKKNIKIDQ